MWLARHTVLRENGNVFKGDAQEGRSEIWGRFPGKMRRRRNRSVMKRVFATLLLFSALLFLGTVMPVEVSLAAG